ncbi:hypothetical protein C8R45DRAFT_1098262 [Mycena sanguinolenta]|nr:hypothetical protein C8R45DRAFT_1098262 [Mycena sanguinolenta]
MSVFVYVLKASWQLPRGPAPKRSSSVVRGGTIKKSAEVKSLVVEAPELRGKTRLPCLASPCLLRTLPLSPFSFPSSVRLSPSPSSLAPLCTMTLPHTLLVAILALGFSSVSAASSSSRPTSTSASATSASASASAAASSNSLGTPSNSAALPSLSGVSACVNTCLGKATEADNCAGLASVDCFCVNPGPYTTALLACLTACPSEVASAEALVEKFCALSVRFFCLWVFGARFVGIGLVGVGKRERDGTPDLKWVSERVDLSKRRLRSTHPGTRRRDARRAGRDGWARGGRVAARHAPPFCLSAARCACPSSPSASTGMPSFTLSTARTHSYACIYSTLARTDNDNGFFQMLRHDYCYLCCLPYTPDA